MALDFSRLGKPIDNCYVESFNGRFREECLNTHWFLLIEDARAEIEAWRLDYNASRPHSTLEQIRPLSLLLDLPQLAVHKAGNSPPDRARNGWRLIAMPTLDPADLNQGAHPDEARIFCV